MKICFLGCLDDLLQKDTGGSIRIYYLAKSLGELGHEVHIVIPGDEGTFEWADRVIVHRMNGIVPYWVLRFLSRLIGVRKINSLFLYDLSFVLKSRHIILNSDLIQTEGSVSSALIIFFIKKIFGKTVVVDSHDAFQALRIEYQNSLRRLIEVFLEKMAYKYADLILTVSKKDKDFLVKYGICQSKIIVIPNGVNTQAFIPSTKANKTVCDSEGFFRVIFVGNMEYLPNQEAASIVISSIAPKVSSRIGNVRFFMIGRAPQKLYANQINSNVIFTGVVENVVDFLTASDVAIAPLLHGSGTRLKILEYFSCGLPVVSTSIGAEGLEVADKVNIFIADDMDKFALSIIDLLMNNDLCARLGKAARDLAVTKYDWRIITKQLDSVYCQLTCNDESGNKKFSVQCDCS